MLLFKSRVKAHTRKTADGEIVQVKEHFDKRTRKPKQLKLKMQAPEVRGTHTSKGDKLPMWARKAWPDARLPKKFEREVDRRDAPHLHLVYSYMKLMQGHSKGKLDAGNYSSEAVVANQFYDELRDLGYANDKLAILLGDLSQKHAELGITYQGTDSEARIAALTADERKDLKDLWDAVEERVFEILDRHESPMDAKALQKVFGDEWEVRDNTSIYSTASMTIRAKGNDTFINYYPNRQEFEVRNMEEYRSRFSTGHTFKSSEDALEAIAEDRAAISKMLARESTFTKEASKLANEGKYQEAFEQAREIQSVRIMAALLAHSQERDPDFFVGTALDVNLGGAAMGQILAYPHKADRDHINACLDFGRLRSFANVCDHRGRDYGYDDSEVEESDDMGAAWNPFYCRVGYLQEWADKSDSFGATLMSEAATEIHGAVENPRGVRARFDTAIATARKSSWWNVVTDSIDELYEETQNELSDREYNLYRGVRRGHTATLPVASWTTDPETAESFDGHDTYEDFIPAEDILFTDQVYGYPTMGENEFGVIGRGTA